MTGPFAPQVLSEEEIKALLNQVSDDEIDHAHQFSLTPLKSTILYRGEPGGAVVHDYEGNAYIDCVNVARNLSFPFYDIRPAFPMASGGITPSMVPEVIKDLGTDIVIGSGGGIHAHPQGPVAGGKAFRQAIDATMKGIPLKEAAKEHPELATDLETWADPFGKGIAL